ncbi:MAG TPA: peptidylprolyl isomerase [Dehalococcoidia bacterium]|nr:peptidylprolyl isomerase [Dehalococcoidia bacterium]
MKRGLLLLAVPIALVALALACGGDDEESVATTPALNTNAATNNCPAPSGDAPAPSMKTYAAAPDASTIDPSKTYIATVNTVRGEFKIKLRPDLAPKHVASFVFLANEHFFDGVTFHRVLPGFVAQTGDPTGTGSGGPGYTIPAEFQTQVKFTRGIVGMARATDPNSAGSQWFVMYGTATSLDGQYTVFGEVLDDGMSVVDCITPRDPGKNPNAPPGDKIISVTVEEQ